MASETVIRLLTAQSLEAAENSTASISQKLGIELEPMWHEKRRHPDTSHRQAFALEQTAKFLAAIDAKLDEVLKPETTKPARNGKGESK